MCHPSSRTARLRIACLALLVPMALVVVACSRFTKTGADKEVYEILDCRRPEVPSVVGHLDVDAADAVAQARRTGTSYRLTLANALALAAAANRDYLRQREDVYLTALDLTGVRRDFEPQFGLDLGVGLTATEGGDGLTPSGNFRGRVSKNFETGGSLVVDLASGFLASLATGDFFNLARSVLQSDIVLPMGRGSGWVARESLTQAERDTLYALRSYARFQQEFTVDVASEYYRVLQSRDTWRNEERTWKSLQALLERQEAMGAQGAGRLPDFQVDQTRQDVLAAENRTLVARNSLDGSLDDLKLTLGIPVDVEITLPEEDLEALRRQGPADVPVASQDAIGVALLRRLDLSNALDQAEDARRRVLVAKNLLGPEADLIIGAFGTKEAFGTLDPSDTDLEAIAGVNVGLPLERTAERNQFRTTLIQAARARRAVEALEDSITLEVRDARRRLELARRSYEIQARGVELAERRVESTDLLLEAGQASTRDRLEAEDALVRARNALTRALVDHAIARLVLELDVGILEVTADGGWVEHRLGPTAPASSGESPAARE